MEAGSGSRSLPSDSVYSSTDSVVHSGDEDGPRRSASALEVFSSRYEYDSEIARGGEGVVTRFVCPESRLPVAVKSPLTKSNVNIHSSEFSILRDLPRHRSLPRIVDYFHDCPSAGEYLLVLPFYSGGALDQRAQAMYKFGVKCEAFIWHVFARIAESLHHLHTNKVCPVLHRDLKPENILLDPTLSDGLFDDVKVCDFGLAQRGTKPHRSRCGTPKWQPPEGVHSVAADVYALGAIIHYLCTGRAPKPQRPAHLQGHDSHTFYARAQPEIESIVDIDTYGTCWTFGDEANYGRAWELTFDSGRAQLPRRAFSPLLEYWMRACLATDPRERTTTSTLLELMKPDATRQIEHYAAWTKVCGARPVLGFIYPEPPAGWTVGQPAPDAL